MLTITCKALRVPSGGQAPLCTPVDSAQPSPRPGTASAPPTTNRVTQLGSGSAGTRLPGSIQGHLWGQGGHAHWPGTRAVPRTAQPDARSATAAGFLSSRLQNGESPSPPRGLVLRLRGAIKRTEERRTQKLSLYLIGGQAVQGMQRFRWGGMQLAEVTQQGQVPKNSVMRLSEKQTRRR